MASPSPIASFGRKVEDLERRLAALEGNPQKIAPLSRKHPARVNEDVKTLILVTLEDARAAGKQVTMTELVDAVNSCLPPEMKLNYSGELAHSVRAVCAEALGLKVSWRQGSET